VLPLDFTNGCQEPDCKLKISVGCKSMCRGLLAVTHWGKQAADGNWPLDIDDKAVLDPSATVL
jgi:hypothetical protein